ncbi:MAG: phage replisome organizer N-terminal domain-containing protein [Clostridia bacterium]|nr:phage replisome organizer N-terminal domain-containing protein [Clostridia bacterium]
MADVQWIRLYVNTFNVSRKLKQIEHMKDGDTILIIWVKLLCLAGAINDGGMIYVTSDIPFTVNGLAEELRKPTKTVQKALDVLALYEQIIMDDAGFIKVLSWDKYQNVEGLDKIREQNRLAQQRSRAKKKLLNAVNDTSYDMSYDSNVTVTVCHVIEEEKDKEKEFNSFILSREETKRKFLGGTLGKGVVMLSDEQVDDLLDKLSFDEFEKYVSAVADCELNGKHFKKKTHYQAILEMAKKDRKIL